MTDGPSPAQLLFSRRLRTKLPTTNDYLTPRVPDKAAVSTQMSKRKQQQAKYYNKTAMTRPFAPLQPGDSVRMQKEPAGIWRPAVVTSRSSTPRSYVVKTEDGGIYRRNSGMLRKTRETFVEAQEPVAHDLVPNPRQEDDAATAPATPVITTYYGRQIRLPVRYPENEWQHK